jgi:stage II sporulation protein P
MVNYILEDIFNNNSYKTLVEEGSIKEILNKNNWKYSSSYKASRQFLDKAKKNNPSLKYFIDIHRDSLKKERTTISINDIETLHFSLPQMEALMFMID